MNAKLDKVAGKTALSGFQVGVRRTFPVSAEQAWMLLTSPEGVRLWLGNVPETIFEQGARFHSMEGISGEFRIVKLFQQFRLRWKREEWEKPSTLQIRLLPSKSNGTTISFHQENLDHPHTRELMKHHWEDVLNMIGQRITESYREGMRNE